jgi:16S rRNA processing protein RimM
VAAHWVRIGTIRSVNPARREVRVTPEGASRAALGQLNMIRIHAAGQREWTCRVDAVNTNPENVIVRLSEGVTRDAVAAMKGAIVEAPRSKRRVRSHEDVGAAEWPGLEVFSVSGERIGVIVGCVESSAHDILEIECEGGGTMLLPAIVQTVESIDLKAGRVVVGDIMPYVVTDAD